MDLFQFNDTELNRGKPTHRQHLLKAAHWCVFDQQDGKEARILFLLQQRL